jgi:hypothetical protein
VLGILALIFSEKIAIKLGLEKPRSAIASDVRSNQLLRGYAAAEVEVLL